jgi:hypothetical protein
VHVVNSIFWREIVTHNTKFSLVAFVDLIITPDPHRRVEYACRMPYYK